MRLVPPRRRRIPKRGSEKFQKRIHSPATPETSTRLAFMGTGMQTSRLPPRSVRPFPGKQDHSTFIVRNSLSLPLAPSVNQVFRSHRAIPPHNEIRQVDLRSAGQRRDALIPVARLRAERVLLLQKVLEGHPLRANSNPLRTNLHPFAYISENVVKPPGIWLFARDRIWGPRTPFAGGNVAE